LAYGDDLAQRFGRRNKEKIETFGKIFFDISLSKSKSANDDFELDGRKGRMITRGIMAGVTGNPAHLLIIDDPVRTREEAYSAVTREKIWQEWISSVKTRLAGGAKVILIMTRWHEDDLAGQILKTEKNVVHINIPCEAEDNDVLGRKKGEGLFPEIGKGTAWKDQMKASYIAGEGLDAWNAMYQGRPSVQGGNIFKRDWFKFYTDLPTMYQTIISVDAAFKDTKTSDFVAIGVWGKSGANVYLLDLINERMDFVRTLEVIRLMKKKYAEANMVLIEDKANGSAIISTLRQEIMGIVPVEPLGSKESRAYAIQPFVMAGNVWLPKNAPWVEEYLDQMTRFPKSSKDDMVDMTTQALIRLKDFVAEGVAPPKPKPDFTILQQPKSIISQLTNIKVSKGFMNY
jgi:predicted phage terminase large subunit-like protein